MNSIPPPHRIVHAIAAFGLTVAATCAAAAAYPVKPLRLIVPYPPAGPTDLIARTINVRLAERLGQPVVVDNRAGADAVIGAEIAAHAPADGYTLLVATVTTLVVNPLTKAKLPYDAERDFAPVSMLAAQPYVLAVHPSLPINSVAQLVAYAKANPGKLNFGSANVSGSAHLAAEMLKQLAGIDVLHVPYRGTAPALTDLIAGRVSFMFTGISTARPLAVSGRLRVLAVSTEKRSPAMPEVPTVAEAGVPGYATTGWNSLVAPSGTPRTVVDRLNAVVRAIMNSGEVRERLTQQGIDVEAGTPEDLARFIKAERVRLTKLIAAIGLKPT